MPTTYYHTLNGELLGETGPGGRRFYGKDALGSVVATYDQDGTLENTYRYKPYGGLLSKTGSAPDPRFMWTGSTGSRTTGASYAEQYNRARHYGSRQAGWTSVDPLWPDERAYVYISGRVMSATDPLGLASQPKGLEQVCGCTIFTRSYVEFELRCGWPHNQMLRYSRCSTRPGHKIAACQADCCTAPRYSNCDSRFKCVAYRRSVRHLSSERMPDSTYNLGTSCSDGYGSDSTCGNLSVFDVHAFWRSILGAIPLAGAFGVEAYNSFLSRGVTCGTPSRNVSSYRGIISKGFQRCYAFQAKMVIVEELTCCEYRGLRTPGYHEVNDLQETSDVRQCSSLQ